MNAVLQPGDGSTFRHYLSILGRRKWLVALALVVVPATAIAVSMTREPLYEAEAEVFLSRQNLASSLTGAVDPSIYLDETRFAETQAEIASVPEVARRTLAELELSDRSPGALLRASTVAAEPNVDLLEFKVRDPDRRLAARLANEYARQFTLYRSELDTVAIERALDEVRDRVNELRTADPSSPLVQNLLEKEQELLTMQALQTSNAYVVREADTAAQVRPQPRRDAALGVLFGLGLGLVLAFLAEALDTRIRSVDELAERLSLLLLGTVPAPPRWLRQERLVMLQTPDAPEAEAYRIVRTNIDFANLERNARVIMLTSSVEEEGKSTTAANLAVAYARAGRTVALVDFDLRRPTIHDLFSMPPRPGLTDVALGYAELDDAIARVPVDVREQTNGALELLPAGTRPPDPSEFIGSGAVDRVLEQVRERADIVLVDAPPLLQVGDPMVLSSKVDAILLVARLKTVRRPMMRETRRVLDGTPTPTLGFVVTGVDRAVGYGYAYHEDGRGGRASRWRLRRRRRAAAPAATAAPEGMRRPRAPRVSRASRRR